MVAVEVKDICARYGQHYNTGSLPRQFGQVMWRILRHAFPSRPARVKPLVTAEQGSALKLQAVAMGVDILPKPVIPEAIEAFLAEVSVAQIKPQ